MKKKNYAKQAAMAAVILITVLLLTNCFEAVDYSGLIGINKKSEKNSYLTFTFGKSTGRTIMPSADDYGIEDFEAFLLTVKDESDTDLIGYTQKVIELESGDSGTYDYAYEKLLAEKVPVTDGETYTVIVEAYLNYQSGTGDVAAYFEKETDEADEDGIADFVITLRPVITGGSGTLTYSLEYIDNATPFPTGSLLNIFVYGSTIPAVTTTTENIDLVSNPSSLGITIPAGIYQVEVTIPGGVNHQSIKFIDVLHIYPDMTSNWTKTFASLATNTYNIIINNTTGIGTGMQTLSYTHGQLLTANSAFNTLYAALQANSGYQGLFRDALFTNEWNVANNTIYRAMNLYVQWDVPPELDITNITFSLVDAGKSLFFGAASISLDQEDIRATNGGTTPYFTYTITSLDPRVNSSVLAAAAWSYDQDPLWSHTGATLSLNHTSSTAPASLLFTLEGTHTFTVVITIDVSETATPDLQQYSGELIITVTAAP